MRKMIMEILQRIESEKRAKNQYPTYSLLLELKKELYARFPQELENADLQDYIFHELMTLQQLGIVRIGRTMNDKYIVLNDR